MAVFLALVAGLLTMRAQRTVAVVVAVRDLRIGSVVASGDIEIRRLNQSGVPVGALSGEEQALGRYVAWPLTGGEPVLGRALQVRRSASTLRAADVPPGYRAVAVPVQPASAVGGMVTVGDRVDVYFTPARQEVATGQSGEPSTASLLGRDVMVLEVRSDQGQPLVEPQDGAVHSLNLSSTKLGSVVLAVPDADAGRYALAAGTSNSSGAVYLAMSLG